MEFKAQIFKIIISLAAVASAQAATLVVPNGLNTSEGNDNNAFPFSIEGAQIPSMRYQQVYGSSQFGALSATGEFITEIRLRPDAANGSAFAATLPDIQINLSTTAAAPDGLSATFANNVGVDNTIVFSRGPLTTSSGFTGPAGGPKTFDIVIPLTTPFFYNPTRGNLLLDVRNYGGGTTTNFDSDTTTGDSISRVLSNSLGNVNSPTANQVDTRGLVTQFTTVVPEPAVSAIAALGLCVLPRRRSRPTL